MNSIEEEESNFEKPFSYLSNENSIEDDDLIDSIDRPTKEESLSHFDGTIESRSNQNIFSKEDQYDASKSLEDLTIDKTSRDESSSIYEKKRTLERGSNSDQILSGS